MYEEIPPYAKLYEAELTQEMSRFWSYEVFWLTTKRVRIATDEGYLSREAALSAARANADWHRENVVEGRPRPKPEIVRL